MTKFRLPYGALLEQILTFLTDILTWFWGVWTNYDIFCRYFRWFWGYFLPPSLRGHTPTKFTLHMVPFLNKFRYFYADILVWFWGLFTNYDPPPPQRTTTIKFTLYIVPFWTYDNILWPIVWFDLRILDKSWHLSPLPQETITMTKFTLNPIYLRDFLMIFDIFCPYSSVILDWF